MNNNNNEEAPKEAKDYVQRITVDSSDSIMSTTTMDIVEKSDIDTDKYVFTGYYSSIDNNMEVWVDKDEYDRKSEAYQYFVRWINTDSKNQ